MQTVADRYGDISKAQVARLMTGKSFFSGAAQVKRLAEILGGDIGEQKYAVQKYLQAVQERLRAPTQRPADSVRVGETDPRMLGVHPAIAVGGRQLQFPAYVGRDADEALRAFIPAGGLIVLVGGSSVGKTRTAYEAIAAVVPKWSLIRPADGRALAGLEPFARTVIWVDELQRYLDDPAVTPEVIHRLLTAAPPTVMIGTMWPGPHAAAVVAKRADGTPAAAARILDLAATVRLGEQLTPTEKQRAERAAANDAQIRAALATPDYGLTQSLAAAPQLISRVRDADPIAAAVITAAVDAVRLGVRSPLPAALLRAAAPSYCAPAVRAKASGTWFEDAIAYAAEELRGAAAVLAAQGSKMASIVGYRLADYVHQELLPQRQPIRPPEAMWDALMTMVTDRDDLERVAQSAEARALYRYARQGYTTVANGLHRSIARTQLAGLLARAGDLATLRDRAEHGDDAADKALAAELYALGEMEELTVRAESSPAARERLAASYAERDLSALATLAEQGGAAATHYVNALVKARRRDDAVAFMRRQSDRDPTGLPDNWWAMMLLLFEGNLEELTRLAKRSVMPWSGPILARARVYLGELQQLRDTADGGDAFSAMALARELVRRGLVEELQSRAEDGDHYAERSLAAYETQQMVVSGDLVSLRELAERDPWSVDAYAEALVAVGDVDTLSKLADAGNDRAARYAADLLTRSGDEARLREAVDRGRPYAADALADVLAVAGRTVDAELMRRFGLRADGSLSES